MYCGHSKHPWASLGQKAHLSPIQQETAAGTAAVWVLWPGRKVGEAGPPVKADGPVKAISAVGSESG